MQFLTTTVSTLQVVSPGGDCEFEGGKVCHGAITKAKGKFLEVCTRGKLRNKLARKVKKGAPMVGKDTGPGFDCNWYGTVYCNGDVVQDLYRWWFLMKCSAGIMRVYSRSYEEVSKDKRYKNSGR